ncbi:MAG: carboxy terminal-processing peptidase [Kiritimatiellae bacterium]|nr:carboxy terminal-processing peptidase [Kiritimatiellia bacterium]
MSMNFRIISVALILASLSLPPRLHADNKPILAPNADHVRAAKLLALNLPLRHLSRAPLSDAIATNAFSIFLDSLDFEHVYFLQSDIEDLKPAAPQLDDQLRAGDLSFAFRVYDLFKQRVENRVAYVKELLDKGFDVTKDESYNWKRKDAPYAANVEEWDELWRLKIKNEFVAFTVSRKIGGTELEEGSVTNASLAAQLKMSPDERILKNYEQFLTVLQDNDANWVTERFLNAFARAYDPHSDYLSPWGAEDFEIGMKLSLQGIGALLSTDDGAAKVERIIPGGPAERDGRLKAGDKIIAVAQGDAEPVSILHWPLSKAVRLIRGEKGSKVVLTVIPADDASGAALTTIDIVRDEVKLEEQAAKSDMRTVTGEDGVEHKIGIITLPDFYADLRGLGSGRDARSSSKDVKRLLDTLRNDGAEALVLDLRNNGGGSLMDAIQMTGLFFLDGPVVQVRDQRRVQALDDPDPTMEFRGPVAVLVNRLSASASEILAGALQDYSRAIIIGDSKTHGKGTVQTLLPLSSVNTNVGQIKITTASFYRIAGGSTQLRGVEPDIVIPSVLETMDIGEETLPHALPWSQVAPADYSAIGDLPNLRSELIERSRNRLDHSEKFTTYTNLLSEIARRQKAPSITLNLDTRLSLADSERAMRKALDAEPTAESVEYAHPPETNSDPAAQPSPADAQAKDKKRPDFVLDESLQVLCDWLSLEESAHTIGAVQPQS